MNKKELVDFEKNIIKEFKKGETYGPVHLSGGNEDALIKIFKKVKPQDWIFSTHRSHYHALLKSQDKKWLTDEIIKNANSSHINSRTHKIFTSAIVGGIIPIALGVAMGIKRKWEIPCLDKDGKVDVEPNHKAHVWCFVGDMASEMGCFHEAIKYANGNKLPITFIIEDNAIGCNSPTKKVWGGRTWGWPSNVIHYTYVRYYPHYGIGEWVIFKKKKFKSQGDYNAYK